LDRKNCAVYLTAWFSMLQWYGGNAKRAREVVNGAVL
jgi:hypothetical protein